MLVLGSGELGLRVSTCLKLYIAALIQQVPCYATVKMLAN